jgi:hypothetical protein
MGIPGSLGIGSGDQGGVGIPFGNFTTICVFAKNLVVPSGRARFSNRVFLKLGSAVPSGPGKRTGLNYKPCGALRTARPYLACLLSCGFIGKQ